MLKKLLKYDFKAMFKFWWIVAAINLALSVFGGFVMRIEAYDHWFAEVLSSITGFSLFMVNCSYVALVIVSFVLIFIRFYRNFFTDEGYLTFTLPVSRKQLLNSKVISGISTVLASLVVCSVNLSIMNTIGYWPEYLDGNQSEVGSYFAEGVKNQGLFFPVYLLELVVLVLALVVLAVLLLYFCITFGSMIVKKGKLVISIVLCYGISSSLVGVGLFAMIFWFLGYYLVMPLEPGSVNDPITALILLGVIFYTGALSGLLYCLQYGMLDKKLNLS